MRSPQLDGTASSANDQGRLRVLLVVDDPTDLRLIARAFGAGHDPRLLLLRAGSLGEALDTLAVSQISPARNVVPKD